MIFLWNEEILFYFFLVYFGTKYLLYDFCLMLLTYDFLWHPQHGGSTNAFTASEHTNYHFNVNVDCFEEALDRWTFLFLSSCGCDFCIPSFIVGTLMFPCGLQIRFAQFFIKPLMSVDATSREIKAVDSGQILLGDLNPSFCI